MLLCLLNIPNEYTCENLPENWLVFENLSNEKTQTNKSNPGCFAFKTIKDIGSIFTKFTLREKCPYLEFFWSVFSLNTGKCIPKKIRIRTIHAVSTLHVAKIDYFFHSL